MVTVGVTLSAVTEIHFHWAGFFSALLSTFLNVGHRYDRCVTQQHVTV